MITLKEFCTKYCGKEISAWKGCPSFSGCFICGDLELNRYINNIEDGLWKQENFSEAMERMKVTCPLYKKMKLACTLKDI